MLQLSLIFLLLPVLAQTQTLFTEAGSVIRPLQLVNVSGIKGSRIEVADGSRRVYFSLPVNGDVQFRAGGTLGKQIILIYNAQNKLADSLSFSVNAETNIDDGGAYSDLFKLLHSGMYIYSPEGIETHVTWKGIPRYYLVTWILDNYNTMKGMQYFTGYGKNLVETMHEMQRNDGMIWSFISSNKDWPYFKTAYEKYGFFLQDSDAYFVRQPVENHVEYNYVSSIYKCWKAGGDDGWMKNLLTSAEKALDYCVNDSLRWSYKYGLLKRALTIDSWDFQVNDEYTPQLGIGNPMLVVNGKTKFGVFYGDNTGYIQSCNELATMLAHSGQSADAAKYKQRAMDVESRLNALAWNGRFFTHFIEEDSSVKRNLGVDVMEQISQSNAYSINRGISHEKSVAIIKTYQGLRSHLPKGAPAEWFTIYPPYQRGFDVHDVTWQYMNGGVGGHVAGELSLGAFDNGYETYGADILNRLHELGKKYGDNKRIWFAYTGSFPDPPPVHYKTIDISAVANKNWTTEFTKRPMGKQTYHNIPFLIPAGPVSKEAVTVSSEKGWDKQVSIPIRETAATIYLLNTGMGSVTDNVYGTITFKYADSSEKTTYIFKEKMLSNWWFPQLENDYSGVAWHGPNANSASVGFWWTALANPMPDKKIVRLIVASDAGESIYSIFGITLADQKHYIRPKPESFGGPDNWAAATAMAALVEGLAGVKDSSTAYRKSVVAPRWIAAGTDSADVCIKYAASNGYVSYRYKHNKILKQISLQTTGSGEEIKFHVLLPKGAKPVSVISNGKPVSFEVSTIEQSVYVDCLVGLPGVKEIVVKYE